jgi:hypothetical protein
VIEMLQPRRGFVGYGYKRSKIEEFKIQVPMQHLASKIAMLNVYGRLT